MKKLIVPIIIGLVMFGAAFGGAFYFFRSEKAKEDAAIHSITGTVLAVLQKQGKVVVYTGRVVAIASPEDDTHAPPPAPAPASAPEAGQKAEAGAKVPTHHAPGAVAARESVHAGQPGPASYNFGGVFAIVPATVRYELDYKAIRVQDLVWDEEAQALRVTLPPLTISEPEIDSAHVRQIGGSAPEAAIRKGALGALLEQAREDAVLGQARETARALVERAFAMPLQVDGIRKAKVVVRFADEPDDDEGEGEGGSEAH